MENGNATETKIATSQQQRNTLNFQKIYAKSDDDRNDNNNVNDEGDMKARTTYQAAASKALAR